MLRHSRTSQTRKLIDNGQITVAASGVQKEAEMMLEPTVLKHEQAVIDINGAFGRYVFGKL
jgi:5,10-methylene-tetrahydrofolate dehydrogenase/methenyl tetrahydrofolate cyclohydrolase